MKKNNKHIIIVVLVLICISLNINAQEVTVVDKKGTIVTVNNNQVTSSNTQPVNPLESDIWFDTLNNEVKIYDNAPIPTGTWRNLSDFYSDNIYTTDGTLTSNRYVYGAAETYELGFSEFTRFIVYNTPNITLTSSSFMELSATNYTRLTSATTELSSNVIITDIAATPGTEGNLRVDGSFSDSTNDPGAAGQILSSTVTGTRWINNPVATAGDIKNGVQTTDHGGWYILDGRAISGLSATAQAAATSLGFLSNLPDATNRVLKHPNGAEAIGSTGGQVSTTLTQANLPNINFPTATTSINGAHNHTIPRTVSNSRVQWFSDINAIFYSAGGTTTTSTSGAHQHTVTVASGGSDQSFERYQPYLVVNTFIYLGL